MTAYYSIVSIATLPQLDEKFNVGLICVTPENTFFHFSEAKFNIVSKLLTSNGKQLALSALQGIDDQINHSKQNKGIFSSSKIDSINAVAEPYLGYLSRYNNNLLQFSNSKELDLKIDYTVFKVLFKKYIFSGEVFEPILKPRSNTFATIRNKFRKAAAPYANTNYNVTQKVISDLIAPVKVDIFGKNGAFVAGQSVDFSKSIANLQSEMTSFLYLTDHVLKADKKSKSFVLGDEPAKKDKENHQLWKNIYNAKIVEFVPTSEFDKIIEFMKERGVAPIK